MKDIIFYSAVVVVISGSFSLGWLIRGIRVRFLKHKFKFLEQKHIDLLAEYQIYRKAIKRLRHKHVSNDPADWWKEDGGRMDMGGGEWQ